MDPQVLRRAIAPETFRPFEIVLANGAVFRVPYPDSLYIPMNRKTKRPAWYVHLHHDDDGTGRLIDISMIARIVYREDAGAAGPGASAA